MEREELLSLSQKIEQDLRNAEEEKPSSLSFIRHSLPMTDLPDAEIQTLVVGGSVFKRGHLKRENGELHLIRSSEKSQPPFPTMSDFMQFCLEEIDPTIPLIGVNFAYPLTPITRDGKLDGKLISGMKENTFEGLTGKAVGEEIERAVYIKNKKQVRIALGNDTICLLLSGQELSKRNSLLAGVIGTGINFAFFSNGEEAINTEAANFSNFTRSEEAIFLDKHSASPGKALFEKETAGAYLFQHYNHYLTTHSLDAPPLSKTHELDMVAQEDSDLGNIARQILERSAQLSAALIAGIALYKNEDLDCVIEGSLFWNGHRYKEVVDETVAKILGEQKVTFIKIANSPLLGAAYLVGK